LLLLLFGAAVRHKRTDFADVVRKRNTIIVPGPTFAFPAPLPAAAVSLPIACCCGFSAAAASARLLLLLLLLMSTCPAGAPLLVPVCALSCNPTGSTATHVAALPCGACGWYSDISLALREIVAAQNAVSAVPSAMGWLPALIVMLANGDAKACTFRPFQAARSLAFEGLRSNGQQQQQWTMKQNVILLTILHSSCQVWNHRLLSLRKPLAEQQHQALALHASYQRIGF
jgi:hypothetical protein